MHGLNQTGPISGTPGKEEVVHKVPNSNQGELTTLPSKSRPPTLFPNPALKHCHQALYSSRRFRKINNFRREDLQIMTFGGNLPGQYFPQVKGLSANKTNPSQSPCWQLTPKYEWTPGIGRKLRTLKSLKQQKEINQKKKNTQTKNTKRENVKEIIISD